MLGDRDLFELWRVVLATICGIYATVVTVRSLWGWMGFLSGSDRTMTLMRSYLVVHLLRLRGGRFVRELAWIGSYLAVLIVLLLWHGR